MDVAVTASTAIISTSYRRRWAFLADVLDEKHEKGRVEKSRAKPLLIRIATSWLFLFCCRLPAPDYFVIPYELRIQPEDPISRVPYERFTAIAILPASFSLFFGAEDTLRDLMVRCRHRSPAPFAERFLQHVFNWYGDQIRANPRIYGEHADKIVSGLDSDETILDGLSAVVVITKFGAIDEPIAVIREAGPGADGLLASERHFLDKGLDGEKQPRDEVKFGFSTEIELLGQESLPGHFPIDLSADAEELLWVVGGRKELKTFSFLPGMERRFFPYLYLVGRRHKILSWSGQPIPASITHWPSGLLIDKKAREHYGLRVTRLWLDAYGSLLQRFYDGRLGFKTWRTIKNEHTFGLDLHFMSTTVAELDDKCKATIIERTKGRKQIKEWLVFDPKMAAELQSPTCRFLFTN